MLVSLLSIIGMTMAQDDRTKKETAKMVEKNCCPKS